MLSYKVIIYIQLQDGSFRNKCGKYNKQEADMLMKVNCLLDRDTHRQQSGTYDRQTSIGSKCDRQISNGSKYERQNSEGTKLEKQTSEDTNNKPQIVRQQSEDPQQNRISMCQYGKLRNSFSGVLPSEIWNPKPMRRTLPKTPVRVF